MRHCLSYFSKYVDQYADHCDSKWLTAMPTDGKALSVCDRPEKIWETAQGPGLDLGFTKGYVQRWSIIAWYIKLTCCNNQCKLGVECKSRRAQI